MQTITTIGLDIAKSVFQVHGVGADGPDSALLAARAAILPASGLPE
jgi:transposase